MREISREPQTHSFLVKALREAGNELVEELEAVPIREAHRRPDGEWSFCQIARHVARSERMRLDYVQRILSRRKPELEPVDLDVEVDGRDDIRNAAYEYASLRQDLVYTLWGEPMSVWERTGVHRYMGEISVLQICRELHLHDLEHLWQVRSYRQQVLLGGVR